MKTVQELKMIMDSNVKGDRVGRVFTEFFKKEVISYHYNSNTTITTLSESLNISKSTISAWKLRYGNQATGISYKNRVLLDVRTKCLIVKRYLEDGINAKSLANEYNVHYASVLQWVRLYTDTYKSHIDNLPDGVPYIVKEEKLIYGDKNVMETKAKISENIELLKKISLNLDMGRIEKRTISELIKKEEIKKKELDNATAILAKHGISI